MVVTMVGWCGSFARALSLSLCWNNPCPRIAILFTGHGQHSFPMSPFLFVSLPLSVSFPQGGGSGLGGIEDEEYLDDVLMVDTSTFLVTKPDVLGKAPEPRADMELVFDQKHGQLVLFSG